MKKGLCSRKKKLEPTKAFSLLRHDIHLFLFGHKDYVIKPKTFITSRLQPDVSARPPPSSAMKDYTWPETILMPSDKMKDENEIDNKCQDPGSAVGYKLMVYMILAVILVAIGLTIVMSWISK